MIMSAAASSRHIAPYLYRELKPCGTSAYVTNIAYSEKVFQEHLEDKLNVIETQLIISTLDALSKLSSINDSSKFNTFPQNSTFKKICSNLYMKIFCVNHMSNDKVKLKNEWDFVYLIIKFCLCCFHNEIIPDTKKSLENNLKNAKSHNCKSFQVNFKDIMDTLILMLYERFPLYISFNPIQLTPFDELKHGDSFVCYQAQQITSLTTNPTLYGICKYIINAYAFLYVGELKLSSKNSSQFVPHGNEGMLGLYYNNRLNNCTSVKFIDGTLQEKYEFPLPCEIKKEERKEETYEKLSLVLAGDLHSKKDILVYHTTVDKDCIMIIRPRQLHDNHRVFPKA